MSEDNWLQRARAMLGNPSPANAPMGSGMANSARNDLQMSGQYKQYVTDAAASGQQPLPYSEFIKMQLRRMPIPQMPQDMQQDTQPPTQKPFQF